MGRQRARTGRYAQIRPIAANLGVPVRKRGNFTRVPSYAAGPPRARRRKNSSISSLPLFIVEKLAAFHFTACQSKSTFLPGKQLVRLPVLWVLWDPAQTYSMFKFRSVAFCPGLGLSLLIFHHVHYYLSLRLHRAVRVYTPHLHHPHISKPAGRALTTLSTAFTKSGLVLLPRLTDCRLPVQTSDFFRSCHI